MACPQSLMESRLPSSKYSIWPRWILATDLNEQKYCKCLQKTELICTIQPSILVDSFNNILSLVNKRVEDIEHNVDHLWRDIWYVFAEVFSTFSFATVPSWLVSESFHKISVWIAIGFKFSGWTYFSFFGKKCFIFNTRSSWGNFLLQGKNEWFIEHQAFSLSYDLAPPPPPFHPPLPSVSSNGGAKEDWERETNCC